jgi:hypothetical protein
MRSIRGDAFKEAIAAFHADNRHRRVHKSPQDHATPWSAVGRSGFGLAKDKDDSSSLVQTPFEFSDIFSAFTGHA